MKNFIIGHGETLTNKVKVKSGGGVKKHPYSTEEAKKRFEVGLNAIIKDISEKPTIECADGEVVIQFQQHPSYLAKSYYPKGLLKHFNLRSVGSKSVKVKPEKWAINKHPDEGIASCFYISGKKSEYESMLSEVRSGNLNTTVLEDLQTIECITSFSSKDKIKTLVDSDNSNYKLEVVIHASKLDTKTMEDFGTYLKELDGTGDFKRAKSVGLLTFLPVTIDRNQVERLAHFSHLRVLRSMPELRFNKPNVTRSLLNDVVPEIPVPVPPIHDFKVCIFDGGIDPNHRLGNLVNEIIPADVSGSNPNFLSHGGEVCSAYLFGPYDTNTSKLGTPYTNVDIVRVMSPTDIDPDLFDILSRIESVLKTNDYKYINLSLGPRIPMEDDEVNVWTSVLDSYLQNGECLATVAIGNDGDLNNEYSRIQPPSDMVNSLSVGACDSSTGVWDRSAYSCIGPGRSPGLVKPDGMMFGGAEGNAFKVYSPLVNKVVETAGTSFAAPYALRVAAGIDAITDLDLKPATVKALMIHNTERFSAGEDGYTKECGWGRFPHSPEEVIECLDDEATIVFQGTLGSSEHLRMPIPLPDDIDCTWVSLKATFCINASTDPEHPLHYTRAGLDITFRANDLRVDDDAEHAKTKTFFSNKELFTSEEELREDAHKWETCISREKRFKRTTLNNPVFDVRYQAREQGGAPSQSTGPIHYSLILTIKTQGDNSIYNSILQKHQTLKAVRVNNRLRV